MISVTLHCFICVDVYSSSSPNTCFFSSPPPPCVLDCDCVLPNTLYGNSSVCNETTGQCTCKPRIGGRQCDRCHENAYNTSRGCVGKCGGSFGVSVLISGNCLLGDIQIPTLATCSCTSLFEKFLLMRPKSFRCLFFNQEVLCVA